MSDLVGQGAAISIGDGRALPRGWIRGHDVTREKAAATRAAGAARR